MVSAGLQRFLALFRRRGREEREGGGVPKAKTKRGDKGKDDGKLTSMKGLAGYQSSIPPASSDPFRAPPLGTEKRFKDGKGCVGVLGVGDSGKSTLSKQFMLMNNLLSKEQEACFRDVVWSNLVFAAQKLLQGVRSRNLPYDSEVFDHHEFKKSRLFDLDLKDPSDLESLFELRELYHSFFTHPSVVSCLENPSGLMIPSTSPMLIKHLDRILDKDYEVTQEDIILSYAKTTGLSEMNSQDIRLFDTGGQRSERAKWGRIFPDLDMIFYVIPVGDYDEALSEALSQNRIEESISVFQNLCTHEWIVNVPIVVIINKVDLLEQKLASTPFSKTFPDFEGANTVEEVVQYVQKRMEGCDRRPGSNRLFFHTSCAIQPGPTQSLLQKLFQAFLLASSSQALPELKDWSGLF